MLWTDDEGNGGDVAEDDLLTVESLGGWSELETGGR